MRIAVSGTHCCGKTTLIEEFLLGHPEYAHEPEPYEVLQDQLGEVFAAEPTAEDFCRQLEFNVARLRAYSIGDRVICERSPVDFLAYMLALRDLGRDDDAGLLVQNSLGIVFESVRLLDLIVFLPATGPSSAADVHESRLRRAVDDWLTAIFCDDDYDLLGPDGPVVVEASGTTAKRLRLLEGLVKTSAQRTVTH